MNQGLASQSPNLDNLQRCEVKEDHSDIGHPRGSIPSPLLFLFHIDEQHWGSGDLHVSPFADDVAILNSKLHIAEKRQQQGVDTVTTWSKDWTMLISAYASENSFFSKN